jgi:hypothetical protein
VSDPEIEAAWSAVHDATPAGWVVPRQGRHDEEHGRPWHVAAVDYRTSSRHHEHVEATGRTEAEALRDLAELLRGWSVEDVKSRRASGVTRSSFRQSSCGSR